MPIRLSGMMSGLDTDAIVKELVSAYSIKTNKLKKEQTKLSWKQDKWKSLNTKIKSFYDSVSKLRFTSAYTLKKTTVSDSSKARVSAGSSAINGTQSLKIDKLAKGGYLTGAELQNASSGGSTKVSALFGGSVGTGTYRIAGNGKTKDIEIDGDTTIDQFVAKINDSDTGVKATYDATNKRIFVASQKTGEDADFTLTALDENGNKALYALGVNASSATSNAEASKWLAYYNNGAVDTAQLKTDVTALLQAKQNVADKTAENEAKTADNTKKTAAISYLNAYGDVVEVNKKVTNGKDQQSLSQLAAMSEGELAKNYIVEDTGKLVEATQEQVDSGLATTGEAYLTQKLAAYGIDRTKEVSNTTTDENGNEVTTTTTEPSDMMKLLAAYKKNSEAVTTYESDTSNSEYYDAAHNASDVDTLKTAYTDAIEANNAQITSNNESIAASNATIAQYGVLDSAKLAADTATTAADKITPSSPEADIDAYVEELKNKVQYFADNYSSDGNGGYQMSSSYVNAKAHKENGTNAQIQLNGVTYTNASNTFNINGLTVEALGETSDTLSVTTSTDTQGLYNKMKDILSDYNSLLKEMSKLYNADSAKGYEPLTSEEKSVLSDTEVEEWEDKVKSALLRKDSTLGGIISAMTTSMSVGVDIDGKKYSLASLGIKTLGYFNADGENRYALHIDGDEDDDATSANTNKLMSMLNEDPEKAIEIFKKSMSTLYDKLDKKMKGSTLKSAYSVYNDKEMKQSYSDYTKKISKWEDKVAKIEDSYYAKFTAMEKALAKLQNSSSAFSGLFSK